MRPLSKSTSLQSSPVCYFTLSTFWFHSNKIKAKTSGQPTHTLISHFFIIFFFFFCQSCSVESLHLLFILNTLTEAGSIKAFRTSSLKMISWLCFMNLFGNNEKKKRHSLKRFGASPALFTSADRGRLFLWLCNIGWGNSKAEVASVGQVQLSDVMRLDWAEGSRCLRRSGQSESRYAAGATKIWSE